MKSSSKAAASTDPECQFSGEACSTESNHYRKVISHIFGRNKKCTIGVPDYVWIYYCRKHYQRARYRTGEWPFRQCDLAVDTIHNMRAWGGVHSFNLQLRRRETQRASSGSSSDDVVPSGSGNVSAGPAMHQAPIQSSINSGGFTSINGYQNTGVEAMRQTPGSDSDMTEYPSSAYQSPPSVNGKKKSPTIVARPVPNWLCARIGDNKSFDEILEVLTDLKNYLYDISENGETPHFPDIEILPNLRGRAGAGTKGNTKGRVSKVSSRGGIRKVSK